jgi:hypothetical protein
VEAYTFSLWGFIVTKSSLYQKLIKIGRFFQRPFVKKNKMIRKMAGIASGWTDERDLPPIAQRTFAELWEEKYSKNSSPQPPVTEEEK